jgi:lysophospholipase L1-like esterase
VLGAALAVVLAFLAPGAIQLAGSAGAAPRSGVASKHLVRKEPPPRVATPKRVKRYGIAFFGDSVSVGFGASDRRHGYVARVSRRLRILGRRVVQTVYAKGGVPVAHWERAPIPRKLDAAVVELGTNDVRLGTPPAQFAQEYRRLTSRIRAANPKVRVLCLSVLPHSEAAGRDGVMNAQIRAVCPGTYVDITGLRDRPHIRSSDGFHPNDVGYRLIAQAVESKLKTS